MSSTATFKLQLNARNTLCVSGVISFVNAAQALAQIPQWLPATQALDLDLADLENADSAALAVLVAWAVFARHKGIALHYQHAPEGLRRLARLCEVEGLLGLA